MRRIGPGTATLVEDTTGKGHRSRVVGRKEVLAMAVQLADWLNGTEIRQRTVNFLD